MPAGNLCPHGAPEGEVNPQGPPEEGPLGVSAVSLTPWAPGLPRLGHGGTSLICVHIALF